MKSIALIIIAFLFIACSGGGGGGESLPPDPVSPPPQFMSRLAAGDNILIVIYGTSLSLGKWVDLMKTHLDELYPGQVALGNDSIGGFCSTQGVENLEELVIVHKPDVVFLEWSVNDAFEYAFGLTTEESRANLDYMVRRIKEALPQCEIILMVMNNVQHTQWVYPYGYERPNLTAYQNVYRDYARDNGLQLVDLYPAWKALFDADEARWWSYVPDGLHPNEQGNLNITWPVIMAWLHG